MRKKSQSRGRTPELVKLGKWLTEFRKTKLNDMSRPQLAQLLGVDRSAVRSWENGDFRPSAEKLIHLANRVEFKSALEIWEKAGIDISKLTTAMGSGMLRLTLGLFPFAAGDVVGIDGSDADPWGLIGQPVVVQSPEDPERVDLDLTRSEVQGILQRAVKVDLPAARQSELEKRLAAKDGVIRQGTQAGWLVLEVAGDDLAPALADWRETVGPWRLVLRGARVKGIAPGGTVPLTRWSTSAVGRKISLEDKRIKGRVCCWLRTTDSQFVHQFLPRD
jgi:transcriptional regulator with XRE-family HTH domain